MSEKEYIDQIEGRNSVIELLESGNSINKIFIQKGERHGSVNKIINLAKTNKVVVVEVERLKLDTMSTSNNHQGVIATVPPFNYSEVDDILEYAKERNEKPFILILDEIEDPHNLGSTIRTAETAGVHGIIIPKRRAATVNATVSKVSVGATQYVKVARVNNINEEIRKLKEKGLWIIGTDSEAYKSYYEEDLTDSIAIVIGNEGKGISRLVKESCDLNIKIPMVGKMESLNASVSTGIIVYDVLRQRNIKKS